MRRSVALTLSALIATAQAYTAPTRARGAPPRTARLHPGAPAFAAARAPNATIFGAATGDPLIRLNAVTKDPKDKKVALEPLGGENNIVDLPASISPDGRKTPSEFELNLGAAIDALRADVPAFADRELQWDIYTPNVQLADPTGIQTRGLQGYKQFFGLIRMFRRVMIEHVDVTFKLRYDWSGKKIVVTWYSAWTARGSRSPAHVDAVSYFHLDDQGKVFKHEVDRVQVGGRPLSPPYSVGWLAFREYVLAGLDGGGGRPIPSFFRAEAAAAFDALALEGGAVSASATSDDAAAADDAPPPSPKKPRAAEKKKRRKLRPGACENMWDCDSPMECCDFVMFKMCCRGGVGIPAFMQPALVPIPIPVEDRFPNPPPRPPPYY